MTLKEVKNWMRKPKNSKSKLAWLMGFDSTQAIDLWFYRKKIPKRHEQRLVHIIIDGEDGKIEPAT